jgi:hypothetical protein
LRDHDLSSDDEPSRCASRGLHEIFPLSATDVTRRFRRTDRRLTRTRTRTRGEEIQDRRGELLVDLSQSKFSTTVAAPLDRVPVLGK